VSEHPDWIEQIAGQTALVEGDGLEVAATIEIPGASVSVIVHCDEECGFSGDSRSVTVSVFTPTALFRLAGTATADGRDLHCGPDMTIERIERRQWPRARLDLAVTLCPMHGSEIDCVPGRTVDISVGGACVETMSPLAKAETIKAVIRLSDGSNIECSCATIAVEEIEDGWRYRLSFRDLDNDGASLLEKLVAA
jgi:hypothetical protein